MPFGAIVEKFGIHYYLEHAIMRATKYCMKCVRMKGDWSTYEDMSECMWYKWMHISCGWQCRCICWAIKRLTIYLFYIIING